MSVSHRFCFLPLAAPVLAAPSTATVSLPLPRPPRSAAVPCTPFAGGGRITSTFGATYTRSGWRGWRGIGYSYIGAHRVGKLASRGEGQGQAAGAGAIADSLSIRGTGHATGSFRSPIHGSSPSPSYPMAVGSRSTKSSSYSRPVYHRGSGGSGSYGGSGGSADRQRNNSASSADEIGAHKAKGGGGGGSGGGAGRGKLRPWTAGHRQRQQPSTSPRLTGSRSGSGSGSGSGCGGSEPGSDEVDGGGGGGGGEGGRTTAASEGGGDIVKIHVCDEGRGITRDFPCERRLLLREMKYFQSYLVGASSPYDEIDILVHCDVRIFEWLFQYIHSSDGKTTSRSNRSRGSHDNDAEHDDNHGDTSKRTRDSSSRSGDNSSEGGAASGGGGGGDSSGSRPDMAGPPPLEVPLAVSILISSDFLQMQRLVAECLGFVGEHLTEIVKLPIDLSCLNDKMVLQLAKIVTLDQLAVAKDRKDKLLSRVHKKRIEIDFRDRSPHSDNAIHCCRYCAGLFSEKVRDVMSCRAAPPTVSFRGQLLRRHEPLSPWSLTRTVTSLHRKGMSWTAVYWFLWGLTQPLYCVRCREVFLAGDIGHCRSHPQQAFFPGDSGCGSSTTGASTTGISGEERGGVGVGAADGYYPCCQSPVNRFSLEPPPLGCVSLDHVVRDADEDPLVLRVLQLQRANISYQDWRDAVNEETRAVVKSAVGPGSDGGGTNSTGGSSGGGIGAAGDAATGKGGTNDASTNYGSRGNSSGGDRVRGGGGGGGGGFGIVGTDKAAAFLERCQHPNKFGTFYELVCRFHQQP
ncbi:conserved unknown protein [Ectocarpus siliculosus]|uniref:SANT and BTB domain-containing protein n=1 Tax=Ectocarpus siliculosus TaxID=2880 RepID=D8LHL4_ECTSI|nr:conserved unknown protein [Ectocarpus siliculosus]|eukprot:CBN79296.1 conserved unknown protein [Ectocarpus siliculosus]